MQTRRITLALLLCGVFGAAGSAAAADLNGKWQGTMQSANLDPLEITLDLKVNGDKLTGTTSSSYGTEQIQEGTVKGDDVNFVVLAGGGQFRIVYKGKVVGEELKFAVTIGDMGNGELIVKRAK